MRKRKHSGWYWFGLAVGMYTLVYALYMDLVPNNTDLIGWIMTLIFLVVWSIAFKRWFSRSKKS